MKENDFFENVLELTKKIPRGRVTTYGAIAEFLGIRSGARSVGWALNSVKGNDAYPCHRVVNRFGELSGKSHFGHPELMKALLEEEGIEFIDSRVNLDKHFWKPNIEY